jgi:hypothetical protein
MKLVNENKIISGWKLAYYFSAYFSKYALYELSKIALAANVALCGGSTKRTENLYTRFL